MSFFTQIKHDSPEWESYIDHSFVRQLADGSLPKACFQHYLQQDYAFLIQFTRAWALALYKSRNLEEMRDAQAGINAMLDLEIGLHIDYCQQWGISEADLAKVDESPACVAYTRYVLDCGMTGGLVDLYAALLPCIYGYAEIGQRLNQLTPVADNPYQPWIDMYASDEYQAVANAAKTKFNWLCKEVSASKLEQLQYIFRTATRMEVAFWQMGLDLT